jgi:hypothetical protein
MDRHSDIDRRKKTEKNGERRLLRLVTLLGKGRHPSS